MQNVALYGGSFNPVHYGHLIAAQSVLDSFGFDKIIFIPNGFNPFKKNLNKKARTACMEMLKLALKDNPKFEINPIEINHDGVKFTYDTIQALKKENPDTHFSFIVGSDILEDLGKWYKIDELLKMADFIVVSRDDSKSDLKKIKKLNKKFKVNIQYHKIPEVEISSTEIRNKVLLNKSIKYLTPDPVSEYINKESLYQESKEYNDYINKLKSDLESKLKPKRFKHSVNVMNTAIELAERFGEDVLKAQIAGLVHDCAKHLNKNAMLAYIKENKVEIPEEFILNPATLHAPLGAEIAKRDYKIEDKEILDAIAKHTTGGAKMSKLDKIIYLADYIEPDRNQPGVDEVREIAKYDLDKAVLKAIEKSINYLENSNMVINPTSIQARDNLKKDIENGR